LPPLVPREREIAEKWLQYHPPFMLIVTLCVQLNAIVSNDSAPAKHSFFNFSFFFHSFQQICLFDAKIKKDQFERSQQHSWFRPGTYVTKL
jgi:hypothetical protein